MSSVTHYWEKYRQRNKSPSAKISDTQHLMTDRQTYVSFLEVQVEKATQNALLTQGLSNRVDQLQNQMNILEDRLINTNRLLKLQKDYSEIQEDEKSILYDPDVNQKLTKLERFTQNFSNFDKRLEELEMKLKVKNQMNDLDAFAKEVNSAMANSEAKLFELFSNGLREVDNKIKGIEEILNNKWTHENSYEFGYRRHSADETNELSKLQKKVSEIDELIRTRKKSPEIKGDAGKVKNHDLESKIKGLEKITTHSIEKINKIVDIQADSKSVEEKLTKSIEKLQSLMQKYLKDQKKLHFELSSLEKKFSSKKPKSQNEKNYMTLPSNSPISSFVQARDRSLSDLEDKMRNSFDTFESLKIPSPSFRDAPDYDKAIKEIDNLVKRERPKSANTKENSKQSKTPKSLKRSHSSYSLSKSPRLTKNKSEIVPPKVLISKSKPKAFHKSFKKGNIKITEKPKSKKVRNSSKNESKT
ncbi:unnamed protein product [Blepharisma stoltei]|uniref:Uncharacterized protein n=1 Tax=Blepharisma stoltei TaxID=1481888 RepID=A0AAU9JRY2_9CILI|nr:unnamed protein product [Blepharisma stoltei]